MQILDNINNTIKDDLQKEVKKGSKISIAAACFSIYAYQELKKQLEGLTSVQLAIVTALERPSTHIDDVIERTGLPAQEVLSELTMLQICGLVRQEPGKRFALNISQK